MHAYISVEGRTAGVNVHSGWGPGPHVKLIGATFPIVPTGTVVDKLSTKVPEGLHALAFFCRVEGPHRMGSGKATYLDHNPKLSSSVLLAWEDDGKVMVKADDDMKAPELTRFNSFVRSDADILVVDADRKIAYVSDLLPRKAVDLAWTYKSVSMDAILEYITKKLTMEELDQRATSEQQARDELRELRGTVDRMSGELGRMLRDNDFLEERRATAVTAHNDLIGMLMRSEGLYKILKRLPAKFRPKAFDGFVEAMDSFNEPATA
ncbi:MAG TPA: hypothetical protein VN665_01980 [Candidatus Paceibacterota bacterium]|nr:hypothetical protein [Candidatus Paceibacterota bacterium]